MNAGPVQVLSSAVGAVASQSRGYAMGFGDFICNNVQLFQHIETIIILSIGDGWIC